MRLHGVDIVPDKIWGSAALLNLGLTRGVCTFLIFRLRVRYIVQSRAAALAVVSKARNLFRLFRIIV